MKKGLIALVVLICFAFCGLAYAAADPATKDVPTDHWAYAAVKELVKLGIIDGFPDGTFRGDKPISRYEMAQMVDKALKNEDKATREQKALIDKLASEFALELNNIDTRVTALEKNQSELKISGFYDYRYEWVQHPMNGALVGSNPQEDPARGGIADNTNTSLSNIWLFVDNKFDGNTYFHGLLATETVGGRSTDAGLNVLESFVADKVGGGTEVALGRFFPAIGMGFFGAPWMDGARVSFGDDVKVRLFDVRTLTNVGDYGSADYTMADAKFALGKDANMSLSYVKDSDPQYVYNSNSGLGPDDYIAQNIPFIPVTQNISAFNDYAVGIEFKGIPDVNIKSEYAVNSSAMTKEVNSGSDAKAYFVTVKYKGANPFAPGSFGLRAEYKHADNGFDLISSCAPFEWNAPLNYSQPPQGGYNNNIKGLEYGVEYTIAPRLMIDARYDILKTANGVANVDVNGVSSTSMNFATCQVTYLF